MPARINILSPSTITEQNYNCDIKTGDMLVEG